MSKGRTVSPKLQQRFDEYELHHQNPRNKRTHLFGIPMIVVSILGILARFSIGHSFNYGLLLLVLSLAWYFSQDRRMAFYLFFPLLFSYVIGALLLPLWLLVFLFVGGWIIQYVGHLRYEGKNPAFYQNLQHLLVGPAWVFRQIFLR